MKMDHWAIIFKSQMILKKTASTEAEGIHCANKYTNKDLFGIQIKVKE